MKRISDVILKPMITEKGVALGESGKYVFQVNKNASKGAIVNELKRIYGVDVVDVKTMIMPGKRRRIAKTSRFTKTAQRKKAIVSLKKGQKIDFFTQQ